MTAHFAAYFMLPLAVGTLCVLVTAWLYLLSDYGTWQLFLRSKTRARLGYATAITWAGYVALSALAYLISIYATMPIKPSPVTAAGVVGFCAIAALLVVPGLYNTVDSLVQQYGKIGERRPYIGNGTTGSGSNWFP